INRRLQPKTAAFDEKAVDVRKIRIKQLRTLEYRAATSWAIHSTRSKCRTA
ncbi:hypothetical protein M5D96_010641, partial [Drosophila gunungcola]